MEHFFSTILMELPVPALVLLLVASVGWMFRLDRAIDPVIKGWAGVCEDIRGKKGLQATQAQTSNDLKDLKGRVGRVEMEAGRIDELSERLVRVEEQGEAIREQNEREHDGIGRQLEHISSRVDTILLEVQGRSKP